MHTKKSSDCLSESDASRLPQKIPLLVGILYNNSLYKFSSIINEFNFHDADNCQIILIFLIMRVNNLYWNPNTQDPSCKRDRGQVVRGVQHKTEYFQYIKSIGFYGLIGTWYINNIKTKIAARFQEKFFIFWHSWKSVAWFTFELVYQWKK